MTTASNLRLFCLSIVKRYGSPDIASEEQKADQFRGIFLHDLPVNATTVRAVALACGASTRATHLPANLRGYHEVVDGRMNIYYRDDDCASGVENTILHEIREMMEPIFVELCPGYQPLRTIALHQAANRFAAAVLLPREPFKEKVRQTGLDLVALRELYRKSYHQLLIRMGEVLDGEVFFYGALYELVPQPNSLEPRLAVTCWTHSVNRRDPWANFEGSLPLFGRRGHPAVPGWPVAEAARQRCPQIAERIRTSEEGESDLTAIAQPVLHQGQVVKVVQVVVLYQDGQLLQPQVQRVRPVKMGAFSRELRGGEDGLFNAR